MHWRSYPANIVLDHDKSKRCIDFCENGGRIVEKSSNQLRNYPCVEINLEKIKHNVRHICKLWRDIGIEPAAILKGTNGSREVAEAVIEAGIEMISDSRVRNLQKYDGLPVQKMLVRIPMLSEAEEVARSADVSLHSEMPVIRAVGQRLKS